VLVLVLLLLLVLMGCESMAACRGDGQVGPWTVDMVLHVGAGRAGEASNPQGE